jgi:hypothetical protein
MPEATPIFSFNWDPPLEHFTFSISRFAQEITDFSGLFTWYAEMFKTWMDRQFGDTGSEGEYGTGARWQDLTDRYKEWKIDFRGSEYPIGVLTGALYESMTGGDGWSQQIEATRAEFGMDPGSEAAEYGSYFADVRPVIAAPEDEATLWQKAMQEWSYNVAKDAGWEGEGPSITTIEGLLAARAGGKR